MSTVVVVGGSGDYLDVADLVVRMDAYEALDVTEDAAAVRERLPSGRTPSGRSGASGGGAPRRIDPSSIDPRRGRRDRYLKVPDARTLVIGRETIDLVAVEQLGGRAQIQAIAHGLVMLKEALEASDGRLDEALSAVEAAIERDGLDALDSRRTGELAGFRRFELAAALNRLRSLRTR